MVKKHPSFFICLTGILFLFLFSYMTSPLFPKSHGWDSAFFQLVGAGMTKGYLPYRNFFDMKGPWLFFFQYLGELLWYGRTGIFLVQCVSLGVTLLLCCRIYRRFFAGKGFWDCFFVLLPLYVVMASTMEGGNLTEEWSLPFLFFPMYLSMDFLTGEKTDHKPAYGFGYGICFGVIALIRITNAVLICAIVLTITVFLIAEKKWLRLLQNGLAFMAGVFLAFLPPLLYFGHFGEIRNMLYCTFVFGAIYGTEGFGFGTGMFFILTLFFPVFLFGIMKVKNKRLWLLVISNTLGMMVTLGMGNSSLHDYMLIIPGVMPGIWMFAQGMRERKLAGSRRLMAAGILTLCFAYPAYKLAGTGGILLRQSENSRVYEHVLETAECIPEEERGSVLGYEVPLRWYTIADIMPCSRYCGWQEHYMELVPDIETEMAEMFAEKPPTWIVTKSAIQISNQMMRRQLENNYGIYQENEDFCLYRRSEGEGK